MADRQPTLKDRPPGMERRNMMMTRIFDQTRPFDGSRDCPRWRTSASRKRTPAGRRGCSRRTWGLARGGQRKARHFLPDGQQQGRLLPVKVPRVPKGHVFFIGQNRTEQALYADRPSGRRRQGSCSRKGMSDQMRMILPSPGGGMAIDTYEVFIFLAVKLSMSRPCENAR